MLAKEREEQVRLSKEREEARMKELEELRLKAQSAQSAYAEIQAQLEEAKKAVVVQPANKEVKQDG